MAAVKLPITPAELKLLYQQAWDETLVLDRLANEAHEQVRRLSDTLAAWTRTVKALDSLAFNLGYTDIRNTITGTSNPP